MAEGGAEEESGDMLGPAIAPVHQSPSALNVKAEVSSAITILTQHITQRNATV